MVRRSGQKSNSFFKSSILPFNSLTPVTRSELFGLCSRFFELDVRSKRMSRFLLRFKNLLLTQKIPKRFLRQYEKLTLQIMKQDLTEDGEIRDDRFLFLLMLLKSGHPEICIRIIKKIRGFITLKRGDQSAVIFVYKGISFLSMMMGAKNMPHELGTFLTGFTNKNRGFVGQVFGQELEKNAEALDLFFIGSSPFVRTYVDLVEKINFNSVIAVQPSPGIVERFFQFFYFGMLNKGSIESVVHMIADWVWAPYLQTNKKIIQSIKEDVGFPEEYHLLVEMIQRIS